MQTGCLNKCGKIKKETIGMQTENSGSFQRKKQEETKRLSHDEGRVAPDIGGNEYTAAFILYCQKTLDNFRRIYASTAESDSGLASSFPSNSRLGSESKNDKFEL